jgi:H+-transporting ATPase
MDSDKKVEETAVVKVDENDVEAGGDVIEELPSFPRETTLSDVSGMGMQSIRKREKILSDVTGMKLDTVRQRVQRGDRRTLSDLVAMMNLPEEVASRPRRRQISSNDVVRRMQDTAGLADLRMAEEVLAHGTLTERQDQGISEEEHEQKLAEKAEGIAPPDDFVFNKQGFTSEEAEKLLEEYGRNELPEHVDPKWLIFLRQFWAPMPIMIWIAIIIEIGIRNYIDMGILLFIQLANASISFYETTKAADAVAALKSSLKPTATCKRDGEWKTMDAALLVPGDLVMLGAGSAIPADCRVNHSEIDVDQAALTGESLPVTFYKGDSCKMGSTVVRGEVEATVEFTGANTFFGKTASLLVETHDHTHIQIILMKIMFVLVGLSVILCLINLIYLVVEDVPFEEALSFTVVLLVASIPLAIEIVTTTTLAIGSKQLSKHGAIVARLAAIEDLAGMAILCSDKTGTLTLNKMVLQDDTPVFSDGVDQESVLVMAALAAKWKEPPRDALDRLTLGSVNMSLLEDYEQIDYLPFDPTVKRTEGTVRNMKTGEEFKTTKGAPHIILKLLNPSDSKEAHESVEKHVARLGAKGIRTLAVARTNEAGDWRMMGLLTFLDPPRPDTKHTIDEATKLGVKVKMITGDHLLIAINTSEQLGMGQRIFTAERLPMLDEETKQKPVDLAKNYGDLCLAADGFAQVYPEHKYLIVECLREMEYTVGMTGEFFFRLLWLGFVQ